MASPSTSNPTTSKPTPTYVSPEDVAAAVREKREKYVVIDCRDDDFNDDGHVKGAVNVPSNEFAERLPWIIKAYGEQGSTVVFHCALSQVRGPSAARAFAASLPEGSDVKVQIMQGGFNTFASKFAGTDVVDKST